MTVICYSVLVDLCELTLKRQYECELLQYISMSVSCNRNCLCVLVGLSDLMVQHR